MWSLRAVAFASAILSFVVPVSAHVVASPDEGEAGAYFRTALRVGHGCQDSPTVAVRVKLPDGVLSVRPQAKPGWSIEIRKRQLERPVEAGHGRVITETVDEVAWRGGPLAHEHFDEFGLAMKLPDAPPGTVLWLPTVQECQSGVHRWIEIPSEGQRWGDLDQPAPFIRLIAPRRPVNP
jgi:uncharacterized protein YcnI